MSARIRTTITIDFANDITTGEADAVTKGLQLFLEPNKPLFHNVKIKGSQVGSEAGRLVVDEILARIRDLSDEEHDELMKRVEDGE